MTWGWVEGFLNVAKAFRRLDGTEGTYFKEIQVGEVAQVDIVAYMGVECFLGVVLLMSPPFGWDNGKHPPICAVHGTGWPCKTSEYL